MTPPLNLVRARELVALAKNTTPGPWTVAKRERHDGADFDTTPINLPGHEGGIEVNTIGNNPMRTNYSHQARDAEWIASLPEITAQLAAAVERVEELEREKREARNAARDEAAASLSDTISCIADFPQHADGVGVVRNCAQHILALKEPSNVR